MTPATAAAAAVSRVPGAGTGAGHHDIILTPGHLERGAIVICQQLSIN